MTPLLLAWGLLAAPPGVVADDEPPAAEAGRGEDNEEGEEKPGALDAILRPIDPGRLQKRLDGLFGLDTTDLSNRPRVPKIGEPVFFDFTRPLGDLAYGNELNYLLNSSSSNAPTLQVIEYEYTFADWHSVELDLSYYSGNLELITPFYQATFGVGRRRNWVHGAQVSADIYQRSGYVGGSAVYLFAWKPEFESPFSAVTFLGANRALIGGFHPGFPFPGEPTERTYSAWRPTANVDLLYKLSETLTLGVEDDLFFGPGKTAEYLAFPFLTYEPGEHLFIQVGGGYYRFEGKDQFTVLAHVNIINRSPRKVREPAPEPGRARADEPGEGGPLRRLLGRIVGHRRGDPG